MSTRKRVLVVSVLALALLLSAVAPVFATVNPGQHTGWVPTANQMVPPGQANGWIVHDNHNPTGQHRGWVPCGSQR